MATFKILDLDSTKKIERLAEEKQMNKSFREIYKKGRVNVANNKKA